MRMEQRDLREARQESPSDVAIVRVRSPPRSVPPDRDEERATTPVVFLTVAETAELLRTTPKAVYCDIERGRLRGVIRRGRKILIDRATLLRSLGVTP